MKRILAISAIIVLLFLQAENAASDTEGCMECHRLSLVSVRAGDIGKLIYLTEKGEGGPRHRETYCSDCHTDALVIPHPSPPENVSCLERCHIKKDEDAIRDTHSRKYYAYQENAHFEKGYSCKSCHSEFSEKSSFHASLMCLQCHVEWGGGDRKLLLSTPVHGNLIGENALVQCVDCHTPHTGGGKKGIERTSPSNCFRGSECHDERMLKKLYLGGHVKKGVDSAVRTILRVAFTLFCVTLVALGTAVVWKNREEQENE